MLVVYYSRRSVGLLFNSEAMPQSCMLLIKCIKGKQRLDFLIALPSQWPGAVHSYQLCFNGHPCILIMTD